MYLDWLHKERNDFIAKTGIFANKVLIRGDVYDCLKIEVVKYNKYVLKSTPDDIIARMYGMEIEVVKFAEKEFTFFRV